MPATLRDRGVAVPFTSPMLAGARVRLLERRCDLVVPHPGGGRGVYIIALGSMKEFCAPTLHDARLAERLATLGGVTPASVRAAARAVAAEGAAGRPAASAAITAGQAEAAACAAFDSALLATLARDAQVQATDPAHRARSAVQQLARRTGRTPETVRAEVALLSAKLAEAGLDAPHTPGRCRLLLDALSGMACGIRLWLGAEEAASAAMQVAECAEAMEEAGRLVLDATQKALSDPAALLAHWAAAPEAVTTRIGRLDWLLDGWEQICLLWRISEQDDSRAGALAEAALLLPPVPPEAAAWFSGMPALQARLHARKAAGPLPRTGGRVPSQAVGLTGRNERVRALAA